MSTISPHFTRNWSVCLTACFPSIYKESSKVHIIGHFGGKNPPLTRGSPAQMTSIIPRHHYERYVGTVTNTVLRYGDICNIRYRLGCTYSSQNIFIANNFNPHRKPMRLCRPTWDLIAAYHDIHTTYRVFITAARIYPCVYNGPCHVAPHFVLRLTNRLVQFFFK